MPERDAVVLVADHVVGPGRDRGDVGGHDRGGREVPAHRLAVRDARLRRHVGHHLPVRRGGHGQLVASPSCPAGRSRRRSGARRMSPGPSTGRRARRPGRRTGAVPRRCGSRRSRPSTRSTLSAASPVSVIRSPSNASGLTGASFRVISRTGGRGQVEMRGRARRGAAEPDRADRAEGDVVAGEVQVHLIGGYGDERRALRRFVAGQVRGHRPTVPSAEFARFCRGQYESTEQIAAHVDFWFDPICPRPRTGDPSSTDPDSRSGTLTVCAYTWDLTTRASS